MSEDAIGASQIHVLGIAGSLRAKSVNLALLRAAQELAPARMQIDIFDISTIPLFNGDVEDVGYPEPVADLHSAIQATDALLIVTPEYNYGIPGVLKNALDWASRPSGKSAIMNKPAVIMGASPGSGGTARAQLQLRQTLAALRVHVMVKPEIFVAGALEKFDEEGRLIDEKTRKLIEMLLESLLEWESRLKVSAPS